VLKNAIKYSPHAKSIIVSTNAMGKYMKVSVEDFGIGIHKANQEKIFNLFYRVEKESTRTNGLGIGLYISNEIIKLHRGTFSLKSIYGKGSTFSFTLPIHKKEVLYE